MKKTIFVVFVAVITTFFATGAHAGWILYDNFNNYPYLEDMLNSGKWHISDNDQAIADFSIENGRLRIKHLAGFSNDSAWAQIIKRPESWRGIKATIVVESWVGDARARIGAEIGTLHDNPDHQVWYEMRARNGWSGYHQDYVPAVSGSAVVVDVPNNWEHLYDIFYTNLGWNKQPIVGVPHKLVATFNPWSIGFKVREPNNLGRVWYRFTEKIDKYEEPYLGIGTRTQSQDGTCVVYFDDVYVLK
jgi:hypothetical protein